MTPVIIEVDVAISGEEYQLLKTYFSDYGIKLMAREAALKELTHHAKKIKDAVPYVEQQAREE